MQVLESTWPEVRLLNYGNSAVIGAVQLLKHLVPSLEQRLSALLPLRSETVHRHIRTFFIVIENLQETPLFCKRWYIIPTEVVFLQGLLLFLSELLFQQVILQPIQP
ncbi:uncharacterized protein YALI1_E37080g [Yarrowia lipolytica]|uniref:Uncharacterized protein n=1 Tax=Yarrowia lipolytica TaxID=4952 RepID=A0A1D8NKW1_YARLL|nr:hypothetical protein YALI1_E37080g [Yarrowia lipolytica]